MQKKLIWSIETYLFISIFLYIFGPLKFPLYNLPKLIFFISLYQLSLFIGFNLGFENFKIYTRYTLKSNKKFNRQLFTKFILLFGILFSFIQLYQAIGNLNLINLLNSLQHGFLNAKDMYEQTLAFSGEFKGSLLTSLTTFFSPIIYASIPISVYFFKELTKVNKLLSIVNIIMSCISYFLTGTNIGIFRIIVIISAILLVSNQQLINKNKRLYTLIVILLVIFFLIVFSNNVTSRMGTVAYYSISGIPISFDNWLLQIIPSSLDTSVVLFVSYLSQGYYGFSLALNYEWISTFPVGSSMFLMSKLGILGIDADSIFASTYVSRMSSLWSPTINWHTAYTWLASDLSFWGVAVYMFCIGLLLAVTYREARNGDIIAILLFPLLLLIVLFLPMNNNILANPLTFMPIFTYLLLFLSTRRLIFVRKGK